MLHKKKVLELMSSLLQKNIFLCKESLSSKIFLCINHRKGTNPNNSPGAVLEAAYYGHFQVLQQLKQYNASMKTTRYRSFHKTLPKSGL